MKTENISTDILIIGGGTAGVSAGNILSVFVLEDDQSELFKLFGNGI